VLLVLKVESVEDQQLLLDVIDTPVAAARVPLYVYVVYIDDVQIACAEQFFGFSIAEALAFRGVRGLLLNLLLCPLQLGLQVFGDPSLLFGPLYSVLDPSL
jgi:hypothetical protein